MATARKIEISRAFSSAAARYDEHAAPHDFVAQRLLDFASSADVPSAPAILEIGCGTGILTRAIRQRWPRAILTATDIAPEMVAATRRLSIADRTFVMDGEEPVLPDEHFDLILSNLTFQWFEALPDSLSSLTGLLRPGGVLCFSTMGQESFRAWRRAHEEEGLECGMPDHCALHDLQRMLAQLGEAETTEEFVPLRETGGKALLQHFRAIGAHVPREGYQRLPASALRRLIARFDRDGGQAAYHVLYGKVRHV